MKQIILTIGDTHLADSNYGRHKDYASDCEIMMERVATAVEEYVEKVGEKLYRIVILGDFADTRFSHLEFRVKVENYLARLGACAEKVYCLKGNHDEVSGAMTELDYYTERGLIAKHPLEEKVGGKVVRYVDFVRDPEECAQAHEGEEVEVIFTHNALGAGDNTLFDSVNVSKLDAPKLRVGVMGHIHGEMYFKAHNRHGQDVSILDGGASIVRSATRKDVKSFNLLALHFDGETGKIGSKKIPVNYVEDAFMSVEEQAGMADGKWSVTDNANTQIDFTVVGAGSMDVDDLTAQLGKTATPEVVATVKMLFEKYGKVAVSGTDGDLTVKVDDADDGLAEDIASLFKTSAKPTAKIEDDFDAAEAGLREPDASEQKEVWRNVAKDLEDDGISLDDLCDDDEESEETPVATDEIDALFDDIEEGEDGADSVEDIISEEDRENLRNGIVESVSIGDGISVVYRNGAFVFAD